MPGKLIKYLIGLVAAVGVFALGMSVAPTLVVAPTLSSQAQPTVSFLLDDGLNLKGFDHQTIPVSEPTVLGLLKAEAAKEKWALDVDTSSSMGAFVKQISSEKNGPEGKYWQYWVNGAQPMVAADHYTLKGGETILWTFRTSAL